MSCSSRRRTHLVIRRLQAGQGGIWAQRGGELRRVDAAVRIHGNDGRVPLMPLDGVQNRGVLDGARHDMRPHPPPCSNGSGHSKMAGRRSRRGEGDLVGASAERLGDRRASTVQGQPGSPAQAV